MERRTFFDHFSAWFLAVAGVVYALPLVAFVLDPTPGLGGLAAPFFSLLALYGTFAILQDEYRFMGAWRPSWHEALTIMWIGGLVLPGVVALFRAVSAEGVGAARDVLTLFVPIWLLFIGLPWLVARWRSSANATSAR